jgi:hypothetical protein
MPLRFHATRHQSLRVDERNLSLENMKNVVRYPDNTQRQRPGNHGGVISRYTKTVEDETLVVVAEVKGNDCWLLTGFVLGK